MRILAPLPVSDANLIASNVPEGDHPDWVSGAAYTAGDRVVYLDMIYEALTTHSGVTTTPDLDTVNWVQVGRINRYAAFDALLERATNNPDTITYEIQGSGIITSVFFFRLVADTVRVEIEDATDGVVYDQTLDLLDDTLITDWYAYFYEPLEQETRAVFDGLPNYPDATLRITVDNTGSTAEVGEIAFGRLRDLGVSLLGTSLGIIDYSRKDRDQFGNIDITERGFSDRVSYDVRVDNRGANRVKRLLTERRNLPTVYVGDVARPETISYGFYRDWNEVLFDFIQTDLSIEIEGLV